MNIVITGTSSGIGRALTEHLLLRGHRVWGLARSDQSDFAATHSRFKPLRADVSDWTQVAQAAKSILAEQATVDALIACAGLQGAIGPALKLDPLKWSETVRANLDGTYYAIRAFAEPLLAATRRGKIVCFSGGGSTKARANFSAYGVAKTGVVRLVETLAEELQGQPIDVNAIAPGAINTRLTDEVLQLGPSIVGETEFRAAQKQKANGGASLERVFGLIEFLLSEQSDGISGRLISAPWDPWPTLGEHREALAKSDVYMLRRIVPEERNIPL